MPEDTDAASTRADPYEVLHGHIDEVISEWRKLVELQPWAPRSLSRLINALPEILPNLFRLMRDGATHVDRDFSDFIAHQHGYLRREDSVPFTALAEEWNHLKRACWNVLRRHDPDDRYSSVTIGRLDHLIDDAIGYSLRGYYRPELDELRGRGLERRDEAGDRRSNSGDRRSSS